MSDMYTSVTITYPEGLEIDLATLAEKIEEHIEVEVTASYITEPLSHGGHWDGERMEMVPHPNEAHFSEHSKYELNGNWAALSKDLGPHVSVVVEESWTGEEPSESTSTLRGGDLVLDESYHQVRVTDRFEDALSGARAWLQTRDDPPPVVVNLVRALDPTWPPS